MEIPKVITNNKLAALLLAGIVLFGISWRLMPHVPNFAPIDAIALLGGTLLTWRKAIILPLVTMVLSDLALGLYVGFEWTWLSIVLVAFVGIAIKHLPLAWRISIGAVGGGLMFFAISNFGVWLTSGMYAHTFIGIVNCYVMAVPFFRATLISDVVFATVLLSAAEYATATQFSRRVLPVRVNTLSSR